MEFRVTNCRAVNKLKANTRHFRRHWNMPKIWTLSTAGNDSIKQLQNPTKAADVPETTTILDAAAANWHWHANSTSREWFKPILKLFIVVESVEIVYVRQIRQCYTSGMQQYRCQSSSFFHEFISRIPVLRF